MTMHTVFFKEHEGIVPDPIKGSLSLAPSWSGLIGSQPAAAAAYGDSSVQSKLPSLELSAGGNTTHFTLLSGDCRTAENGARTNYLRTVSSVQADPSMEFPGQFKFGFGQPLMCAQYPCAEQCYGVYSAYGTQIAGRIMLPLNLASDGVPIFVNAKQYNGIMRRRKTRAKAEMQNQVIKARKPFLHLSRHLHAVRRPRGNGGRFLNMKNSNTGSEKTRQKKAKEFTEGGIRSKETNDSRSTSPGSKVTSYLHHQFHINSFQPSIQPFPDVENTGLSIAMAAAGNNYLKV